QGRPVPLPVPGQPSPGPGPSAGADPGQGSSGTPSTQPGGGHGEDSGQGSHVGSTQPIPADELRARAQGLLDQRVPMAGVATGRGAGRTGETANVQGTGVLREVGPSEVSAIERAEVPEEYREQVGRYFQP